MFQQFDVVLVFFLHRRQHCVAVVAGFGVGVAHFLHPHADLDLLRVAGQIIVHGGQDVLDLHAVPGIHRTIKQVAGRVAELGRVHRGQLFPDFSPAGFVVRGVAQFVVEQQFQHQDIVRQHVPAVVFFHTFGQRGAGFVQMAHMAADLGQVAVDVGVHFFIRLRQILLSLADGIKRLFVIALGQISYGEVIVLVGIAARFFVLTCDFEPLTDIKAGQGICAFAVGGHAHQVKAGDDLRAVGIALVINDERFQNFPRCAEIPFPVMQQRRMEVGHHPHIGLAGFLFENIHVEFFTLRPRGVLQHGLLLGKFFVTHHIACTIPGKSSCFYHNTNCATIKYYSGILGKNVEKQVFL